MSLGLGKKGDNFFLFLVTLLIYPMFSYTVKNLITHIQCYYTYWNYELLQILT